MMICPFLPPDKNPLGGFDSPADCYKDGCMLWVKRRGEENCAIVLAALVLAFPQTYISDARLAASGKALHIQVEEDDGELN